MLGYLLLLILVNDIYASSYLLFAADLKFFQLLRTMMTQGHYKNALNDFTFWTMVMESLAIFITKSLKQHQGFILSKAHFNQCKHY